MNYLILFFLFLSGATGLIYEIVWTRQLILIFGSTTLTIVAVLSTFMAGLALGSFFFGKLSDKFRNPLFLYAVLEIGIGISALVFTSLNRLPIVFPLLLVPTIFMGGTMPVVVRFLKGQENKSLSALVGAVYGINTLGAVVGTLLAAFILIETLGLSQSALLTSLVNLLIGLVALIISQAIKPGPKESKIVYIIVSYRTLLQKNFAIVLAFGASGLIAMAYEVFWSRLLTPLTGTYIYAFAEVLALYLFGIAIGSILAKRLIKLSHDPKLLLGIIQFSIGLGAFLIILLMAFGSGPNKIFYVSFVIFLTTISMGMTFPVSASLKVEQGTEGSIVGLLYTTNTLGSLVGPVIAGFLLIPVFGTIYGTFILIGLSLLLGLVLVGFKKIFLIPVMIFVICVLIFMSIKPLFFQPKPIKDRLYVFLLENYKYKHLEDRTASVLAYRGLDKWDNGLIVDGVGMSDLVDETKFMAHLPLLIHTNPKDMLIICFGMGTTFRSALTHNVRVDAVELVPSVSKTFDVFFDDAKSVSQNPNGKIYINDGRNYVRNTQKKYDIIQVDPPPPVNSAGTTVLYSKEFYQDSKKLLRRGGIFNQWFHEGTKEEDFKMLIKTFLGEFKYVVAFRSIAHMGLHILASDEPIVLNSREFTKKFTNPKVVADIREWNNWITPETMLSLYYGDKVKLEKYVANSKIVTDDNPRSEYYLLRHFLNPQKEMEIDNLPE